MFCSLQPCLGQAMARPKDVKSKGGGGRGLGHGQRDTPLRLGKPLIPHLRGFWGVQLQHPLCTPTPSWRPSTKDLHLGAPLGWGYRTLERIRCVNNCGLPEERIVVQEWVPHQADAIEQVGVLMGPCPTLLSLWKPSSKRPPAPLDFQEDENK